MADHMKESDVLKCVKKYFKKNNILHSSKPVFLCLICYSHHFSICRGYVSLDEFKIDHINSLTPCKIPENFQKGLIKTFSVFAKIFGVKLLEKVNQIECTQQTLDGNKCLFFSFEIVCRHIHEKEPRFKNLEFINTHFLSYACHLIKCYFKSHLCDYLLNEEDEISMENMTLVKVKKGQYP